MTLDEYFDTLNEFDQLAAAAAKGHVVLSRDSEDERWKRAWKSGAWRRAILDVDFANFRLPRQGLTVSLGWTVARTGKSALAATIPMHYSVGAKTENQVSCDTSCLMCKQEEQAK